MSNQKPELKYYEGAVAYRPDKVAPLEKGFSVAGFPEYRFHAAVFPVGSRFGINGSRISKLTVYNLGKEVMNYQRGWDIPELKPNTREEKQVLKTILQGFPETNTKARAQVFVRDRRIDVFCSMELARFRISELTSSLRTKQDESPSVSQNSISFFTAPPTPARAERLAAAARSDQARGNGKSHEPKGHERG